MNALKIDWLFGPLKGHPGGQRNKKTPPPKRPRHVANVDIDFRAEGPYNHSTHTIIFGPPNMVLGLPENTCLVM